MGYNPEGQRAQLEMSLDEKKVYEQMQSEVSALRVDLLVNLPRKKRLHIERRLRLLESKLKMLEDGDFGRTIPEVILKDVIERDTGRNFGRPSHSCERPGPPHHIRFFETFTGNQTRENPHTVDNLEAPCKECHELAHNLSIPSGVSIETLFKSFNDSKWQTIEELWHNKNTFQLKKIGQSYSL